MQNLWQSLRYFFYVAINWNMAVALHILKNDRRGEKKYGINTTGYDTLKSLEEKDIDISSATIYMPASYDLLEHFLGEIPPNCKTHLLDIGCGKGRALCVAAHYGFPKLTGIDFSRDLCEAAKENLATTKLQLPHIQYNIINNDAFYYEIPDDVDCIFMFNPFDETILAQVLENICRSLKINPRKLHIIYFSLLHKNLLEAYGFGETHHQSVKYFLQGSLFENN